MIVASEARIGLLRSVSARGEHIERRALPGEWPADVDLDDAPTLIRELARRALWLEQELIAVDPRLRSALEAVAKL
jgi:hypothetical protein